MLLLMARVEPEGHHRIDGKKIIIIFSDKNNKKEELIWGLSDTGSINAGIFGVLTKN